MPNDEDEPPASEARRLVDALRPHDGSDPLLELILPSADRAKLLRELAVVELELRAKAPVLKRSD